MTPITVSAIATGRHEVDMLGPRGATRTRQPVPVHMPLEGMRVSEIGPYTTAPMCGRLRAPRRHVIKIEKPAGAGQRAWVPAS